MNSHLVLALASGALVGIPYALVAYGLAITYRTSRYFNLAQGSLAMVTAYAAFAIGSLSDSLILAACAAVIAGVGASALLQYGVLRRLQGASHFATLVVTIAIGTILSEGTRLGVNDGLPVAMPLDLRFVGRHMLSIGGVGGLWLVLIVVGVAAAGYSWLRWSRSGLALRAVGESPDIAEAFGVVIPRIHLQSMMIGGLTAGLAGLSLAVLFDFLTPFIGSSILFKALALVLVLGVNSVWGLMIAAFVLAAVEAFATYSWSIPGLPDLMGFALIIVVLLIRPAGVFRASA